MCVYGFHGRLGEQLDNAIARGWRLEDDQQIKNEKEAAEKIFSPFRNVYNYFLTTNVNDTMRKYTMVRGDGSRTIDLYTITICSKEEKKEEEEERKIDPANGIYNGKFIGLPI